jgi:hypothetical protein
MIANLNNNVNIISKKIGMTEAIMNDDSSKLLQNTDVSFIQKIGARTENLLESMFHQ